MTVENEIAALLERIAGQMGIEVQARVTPGTDGARIDIEGAGADALLARRGEALQALQHIVDTAFRRQLGDHRILVDCMGFRRDKDNELKAMAKFLAEKAKASGEEQSIGPLNSYERRLVHLAVAEIPDVTSESIGDAAVKTVTISALRK